MNSRMRGAGTRSKASRESQTARLDAQERRIYDLCQNMEQLMKQFQESGERVKARVQEAPTGVTAGRTDPAVRTAPRGGTSVGRGDGGKNPRPWSAGRGGTSVPVGVGPSMDQPGDRGQDRGLGLDGESADSAHLYDPSKLEIEESVMTNERFEESVMTDKDKVHFFFAESLMASEDNPAIEATSFMVTEMDDNKAETSSSTGGSVLSGICCEVPQAPCSKGQQDAASAIRFRSEYTKAGILPETQRRAPCFENKPTTIL